MSSTTQKENKSITANIIIKFNSSCIKGAEIKNSNDEECCTPCNSTVSTPIVPIRSITKNSAAKT